MVSVVKKDLISAVNLVSKVLKRNSEQILLLGHDHQLEIQSNRLIPHEDELEYCGFIVNVPATVNDSLSVDVACNQLKDCLKSCPDNIVHLDFSDDNLQIKSGGSNYSIKNIPTRVKTTRFINGKPQFSLPAVVLKTLVESTAYATDPTDDRASVRGCYLRIDGKNISMVASDTHQIAAKSFILEQDTEFSGKLLLNAKILSDFVKIVDKKDLSAPVWVWFNDDLICLEYENVKLSMTRYKYYFKEDILEKNLIFNDPSDEITCRKDYLTDSLKRLLSLLKRNDDKEVELSLHDHEVHLSTENSKFASAKSTEIVPAETSKSGFIIRFNGKWLLDCLKYLSTSAGQLCRMQFGDKYHPIHIVDPELTDFKYVLCPIRWHES